MAMGHQPYSRGLNTHHLKIPIIRGGMSKNPPNLGGVEVEERPLFQQLTPFFKPRNLPIFSSQLGGNPYILSFSFPVFFVSPPKIHFRGEKLGEFFQGFRVMNIPSSMVENQSIFPNIFPNNLQTCTMAKRTIGCLKLQTHLLSKRRQVFLWLTPCKKKQAE